MSRRFVLKAVPLVGWLWAALGAAGQISNAAMPTTPDAFIAEFSKRIKPVNTPESQLMEARVYNSWNDRYLQPEEKERIIEQSNRLLGYGVRFWPDLSGYLLVSIASTQPGSVVELNLKDFLDLVDSTLLLLPKDRLQNFLAYVGRFALQGEFYTDAKYQIIFPKPRGRLELITLPDPDYVGPVANAPKIRFPGFRVEKTNITLKTTDVVAELLETEGVIDFSALRFYGAQAKYTWARAQLPTDEVYCTIPRYTLSLRSPGFEADSVRLNKPNAPGGYLVGRVKENLEFRPNVQELRYPEFKSYTTGVELIDYMKGADYVGGYSLRGPRQFGTSAGDTLATVHLKHNGARAVAIESSEFALDETEIRKQEARVTVTLGNGHTIFHAAIKTTYEPEKGSLLLFRDPKNRYSKQPFSSTYHRYNLIFETLRWNLASDTIHLRAMIAQEFRGAAVESEDFFIRSRFKTYFGTSPINGISFVVQYILDRRKKEVEAYQKKLEPKPEEDPYAVRTEPEVDFGSDEFYSQFDDAPPAIDYDDPWAEDGTDPEGTDTAPAPETPPAPQGPVYTPFTAPFTLQDLEKAYPDKMRAHGNQLEAVFRQLDESGYIYYDSRYKTIQVRKQAVVWALAAAQKKDYDVVHVASFIADENNAAIDWQSGAMVMNGIDEFILSDSQKVSIRPQNGSVRVYENRDLQFGGLIYAGKANFWGKGTAKFLFDYSKFYIYCEQLDSVKFYPERDPRFNPRANPQLTQALRRLKVEDVVGSIYINHPTNKSGVKMDKKYPVFDCYTTAYVYWSERRTQGGVYKRDQLYFALDPFALDSLESFIIDNLTFQGELETDSIFPSFKDTLKVVSDNTYGVEAFYPEGVPVYRGKGTFTNKVQMDYYGLWGKGSLAYLTTTAEADTFVFHFDSCMAVLNKFSAPESELAGVYFPEMITEGRLRYKWFPYQDRLEITTLKAPLVLHKGTVEFTGTVVYTPKGVIGKGTLASGSITLKGDSINLSTFEIQVVGGSFEVSDPANPKALVFSVKNADSELNVKTGEVEFATHQPGEPLIAFPQQKYVSTLPNGTYNKETGLITLTTTYPEKKFNTFTSTDPGQHGLNFPASKATYSTEGQEINLEGVDSILVADAIAYPEAGKARINPGGKLGLFENARLRADTLNRAHLVDQAQLAIENRLVYKGSGRYPYRTKGVKEQYLTFESLRSLPDTTTYAEGEVTTDQEFLISDRIYFRGKVQLAAGNRFLGFDGEVRIQSENSLFAESWFAFKDTLVNPDTVFVPIDKPKNRAGRPLSVGLHYIPSRKLFYTKFFQTKEIVTDLDILKAEGGLTYNREAREFRVGPRVKIEQQAYRGAVVSYDDDLQIITVRGRLNFPNHLLAPAEGAERATDLWEMAGLWRDDLRNNSVTTRMLVRLKLPALPEEALKDLRRLFRQFAYDRPDINYQDRLLQESAAEFLDTDSNLLSQPRTLKFVQDVEKAVLPEDIRLSRELGGGLVFTDVQLAYNDSVKGFWCNSPIGWSGVGDESIGKTVESKIEYRLGRPIGTTYTTDSLNIYLAVDDNSWVFFRLVENTLYTVSSEPSYNRIVEAAVGKQKEPETQDVQKLAILDPEEVTRYIRRFSQYLYIRR
ncbi:MAG: hypothetical protein SFY70_02330 [Bacteroidia bacterium]|nr:hypothetical protein [Bacteroidia bacterium]